MFWRPILLTNGVLLTVVGLAMLFPMMADIIADEEDWKTFAMSSLLTLFVGMVLYLANRGYDGALKIRQAFLLTVTSYASVTFFIGLPYMLSELRMSVTDAFFEAASGITTTGSTVIVGLDELPPGILLWRAISMALGGIGIVVLALAVLPMLRIGGMQLFRTESSDRSEKMLPRAPQIAMTIAIVFFCLTLLCGWCYWLAGMSGFDAICHALTTISSGGFSNHDLSIGYFRSFTIELIAMVFMLSGAIPLMLYYQAMGGNLRAITHNTQVRFFLAVVVIVTLMLTVWLVSTQAYTAPTALRHAAFATITIVTTTGYGTVDYTQWGSFATNLLFMLIVVGGCTGSTAGGIKIFRYQVLYETVRAQLHQLIQPHGVFVPRYEGKPISESVVASVMAFLLLFAFCFICFSIILAAYGLDFITSMSAVAQALSNVGPGLGDVVGPAGNYSSLPDGAKWVLSVAMIMGRLELFTVIVIFTPAFWNR